jgi:hypothetical protein
MFATYLRLYLPVVVNWRAVVRAAASRLKPPNVKKDETSSRQ